MRRMGHSSIRAAMVYQHATDERDREIADLLAGLVDKYRKQQNESDDDDDDDGAAGALAPTG
jgi:hypothetical protein